LVGYLKKRSRPSIHMKRELASALVLAGAVGMATVLELPPISFPVDFKYSVRDSWEQNDVRPRHRRGGALDARADVEITSPVTRVAVGERPGRRGTDRLADRGEATDL
jgi:hypothetical protein